MLGSRGANTWPCQDKEYHQRKLLALGKRLHGTLEGKKVLRSRQIPSQMKSWACLFCQWFLESLNVDYAEELTKTHAIALVHKKRSESLVTRVQVL